MIDLQLAVGALLVLAVVAANLPWLSDRILFVLTPSSGSKRPWVRLAEWLLLYFLMGAIALGVEQKATGQMHAQDWEFYAVTTCLFIIFALPGFIYHVEFKPRLVRARRNLP